MEYPNPIKITNFSVEANAYRNLSRALIEEKFAKADELENNYRYDKKMNPKLKKKLISQVENLRKEAKQQWRKVIATAEKL